MNLAIIESGSKQYLVKKGDKIQIEKIAGEVGSLIKLEKVLMVADGANVTVGKPFISDASVEAKVLKQARSKKIIVFKYKAKSKYRRKQGHRQNYTELEIIKI
ncbi:MAG: 50S ribosomal protein L21 [Patescibacteria group bacterium]